MCTSLSVNFFTLARILSMSAPFLPITMPGRAVWIDTRHLRCGRSMTILETAACLRSSSSVSRIFRSSCSSVPYSPLVGVPARIPGAVDAEAQTDRIDLLTHYAVSSTWRTTIVRCENGFSIRAARPRPRAMKRFMTSAVADIGFGDDQRVGVEAVIVLGIGDGALERLLDRTGDALAREGRARPGPCRPSCRGSARRRG